MTCSVMRSASRSYGSPGSLIGSLVCLAGRLRLHSAHSPVGPGVPPQAHLRCSVRGHFEMTEREGDDVAVTCRLVVGALVKNGTHFFRQLSME